MSTFVPLTFTNKAKEPEAWGPKSQSGSLRTGTVQAGIPPS